MVIMPFANLLTVGSLPRGRHGKPGKASVYKQTILQKYNFCRVDGVDFPIGPALRKRTVGTLNITLRRILWQPKNQHRPVPKVERKRAP
jgi:hypothetical protein